MDDDRPLQRWIDRVPAGRRRVAVEIAVDTVAEAGRDRIAGLAAEIAFWVLLSLPPLLLIAVSAAGLVGRTIGADFRDELVAQISMGANAVFDASTVSGTIQPLLDELLVQGSPSVLSAGFAFTLFSASRALRVVILALAIAYDLETDRTSWQSAVLGFIYVLAAIPIGIVVVPLVVAGPEFGAQIDEVVPSELGIGTIWKIGYWPGALVTLTAVITLLYHRGAPWWTPYRRDVPGAVLATALGLLASVGLRLYTRQAFGGDALYAPLAAPLAILVWVWTQGIALLLGAELNAVIERRWPLKDPDQGQPLQRLSRHAMRLGRRARAGAGALKGILPGRSHGDPGPPGAPGSEADGQRHR